MTETCYTEIPTGAILIMNMDIIITIIVVRPQRVIIPMDQVMDMDTTMGVTVTLDKKIGQERMDTQHLRFCHLHKLGQTHTLIGRQCQCQSKMICFLGRHILLVPSSTGT